MGGEEGTITIASIPGQNRPSMGECGPEDFEKSLLFQRNLIGVHVQVKRFKKEN